MTELKWIEDLVTPETSDDAIGLLKITDEFQKFPTNFINAKGKRMDILKSQMVRIIELDISNVVVADIADDWLNRLEHLMWLGDYYGRDKWYQKGIRKTINNMKKAKEEYPERIMNSGNNWFSYSADDIMRQWKKKTKH